MCRPGRSNCPAARSTLTREAALRCRRPDSSIRLDVDARKSIQLTQAGNSGKCIFRPVIFVDIEAVDIVERCPAVFRGEVRKFLYNKQNDRNGFVLDLPGQRGELNVIVDDQTVIFAFDVDGLPDDIDAIQIGDTVYVRGPLTAAGKPDSLVGGRRRRTEAAKAPWLPTTVQVEPQTVRAESRQGPGLRRLVA